VTPLVLAHRGACWEAPENTLEAFELAVAEQADYVEFDVRARDGDLVICHDPGPPDDAPTLDAVLAALNGRVGLAVEVKEEETTGGVLDALERHGVEGDELLMVSFRIGALETVRRRRPERLVFLPPRPPMPWCSGEWGSRTPRRTRTCSRTQRSSGSRPWSSPSMSPRACSSSRASE
jgi:glycerophosphoryl diester phosphodiesterase